jgi:hypothetical protein
MQDALSRYPDALNRSTMELAWFLTGLSEASATEFNSPKVLELTRQSYEMVLENRGESGIFAHLGRGYSPVNIARKVIGSFADQVYPTYAFARYSQAFGDKRAAQLALETASAICNLQGPLGQWWWHYSAKTGVVGQHYPVFSVHQDAMAPMALLAVSKLTGTNFTHQINKGLEWIYGNNELNTSLVDRERGIIWRNIYGNRYKCYFNEVLGLTRHGYRVRQNSRDLAITFEDRPYHCGWVLFAFAEC